MGKIPERYGENPRGRHEPSGLPSGGGLMKSMVRSAIAASLVAMFSLVGTGAAQAADVTLYEVSEAVKLDPAKGGKFKSNSGTLTGWARAGTALCPQFIVDTMVSADANKVCTLSIDAAGRADDVTGIGPVTGTLIVQVQDKNQTDAPEISVITGLISGTINMSAAFQNGQPLGSISGRYQMQGAPNSIASRYSGSGTFTGTFRLPFALSGSQPQYLLDDGSTVAVAASEYVLRYPAVRLEVTLTPSTTAR
jgi:hypothetical protein